MQMQQISLLFTFVFLLVFSAFGKSPATRIININLEEEHQVMHSFGASDSWRCQFIGANWPEAKKEKMTEWLFSKELDKDGNPLGIGLSMWRFYIGAGSMEQGDSSEIVNPWRRAECFLSADGSYDWTKQKGEQWFLRQAHKYGVENTMAFSISAPVHYTINGKAFSPKNRTHLNIKDDRLDDYAGFLADVCEHFEEKGLGFDYLSPFNEPQWDWSNPTQEGTPATNEDLFLFSHFLNHEFSNRSLRTEMALGEAAEFQFLYKKGEQYAGSSDQFMEFLSEDSPLFIGQFGNAAPLFSAHSYFTTWPVENLINIRQNLRQSLDSINTEMDFWQSEFCILEKNSDIGGGNGRDLGMGTALYVARVIHHDLTLTNATSWQWWTALTQCNYKDGLVYLDNGNEGIPSQQHPDNEALKYDGNFHDSKLMWALGNYSRFVRPGMVRVQVKEEGDASLKDQAVSLMVSGYKNTATGELVLVIVNYSGGTEQLILKNSNAFEAEVKAYLTSEKYDLGFKTTRIDDLEVEPQSVKTFILKMKP
jgi:hypothetical protein